MPVGLIREFIKEIALLSIDEVTHSIQFVTAISPPFKASEQLFSGVRFTPQCTKFILNLEQVRQIPVKFFNELSSRYRGNPNTGSLFSYYPLHHFFIAFILESNQKNVKKNYRRLE